MESNQIALRAEINQEEAKKYDLSLGQKIGMSSKYDPGILRAVPREDNRKAMNLGAVLPFNGFDAWNCYEVSFLTDGRPSTMTLKIIYSASSPSIVESKSLKLYLGSFAMEETTAGDLARTVKCDLENLLQTYVEVGFTKRQPVSELFGDFGIDLDKLGRRGGWKCSVYNRDASLLELDEKGCSGKHQWFSTSLRSNCRVTHQPDYGTVFISLTGNFMPTEESLFKYIASFRGENHFHEEIVEQIFVDLNEVFNPFELSVCAMYTRRGGIDINPVRYKGVSAAWTMPFGGLADKYTTFTTNMQ